MNYNQNKNDFLEEVDLNNSYNIEVVNSFKFNKLCDCLKEIFEQLDTPYVERVVSSDSLRNVLGLYYEDVMDNMGYDLGANS
jgi:hypothetical protein